VIGRPTAALASWLILCSFADSSVRYQGRYVNKDYGFEVTIPPGYVGIGAALSAPNHGFLLKTRDGAMVSVVANYDTVQSPSGESFEQQMMRANGPPAANLGGLKAWASAKRRVERGRHRFEKGIVARRVSQDGDAIIYSISEDAQEEAHGAADRLFEKVVDSFRVMPVDSKQ